MRLNLVIMQPRGYVHSLCFLDTARYLRHQFRRLGWSVEISKNVASPSALNILFGAHLGLPDGWGTRVGGVIFNQEQLGAGGPRLADSYIALLRQSHVIDYDAANLAAYRAAEGFDDSLIRGVVPLLHAPYLQGGQPARDLSDRPIDLLFFGSMNEERMKMIQRIERCGRRVHRFDTAVYGDERDQFVRQSKAVLNLPFYQSNRFERVRAFHALSLGTPVVSLRRPGLSSDPVFDEAVQWFTDEQTELYFSRLFATPPWNQDSMERLRFWQSSAPDADPAFRSMSEALVRLGTRPSPKRASDRQTPWLNFTPEMGQDPGWSITDSNEGPLVEAMSAEMVDAETERLCALLGSATQRLLEPGIFSLEVHLGHFIADSEALKTAREWALGRLRLALEQNLLRSEPASTFDLQQVRWKRRADANDRNGQDRPALESGVFILHKRALSLAEAMRRCTERADFGGLPSDDLSADPRPTDPIRSPGHVNQVSTMDDTSPVAAI